MESKWPITHGRVIVWAVGLIVAACLGYSWLKAHDAWTRFQVASQIKGQQIAIRDKQAALDRAAIQELKRQVQTPQQVVREIPKLVELPAQPQLPVAGSQLPATDDNRQLTTDNSPDAPKPQGVWFPPQDVKPLFDRLADCKVIESQLSVCQQNFQDVKQERDLAVNARKGSSWRRAKQIGIGIAIGGAIGYAARR